MINNKSLIGAACVFLIVVSGNVLAGGADSTLTTHKWQAFKAGVGLLFDNLGSSMEKGGMAAAAVGIPLLVYGTDFKSKVCEGNKGALVGAGMLTSLAFYSLYKGFAAARKTKNLIALCRKGSFTTEGDEGAGENEEEEEDDYFSWLTDDNWEVNWENFSWKTQIDLYFKGKACNGKPFHEKFYLTQMMLLGTKNLAISELKNELTCYTADTVYRASEISPASFRHSIEMALAYPKPSKHGQWSKVFSLVGDEGWNANTPQNMDRLQAWFTEFQKITELLRRHPNGKRVFVVIEAPSSNTLGKKVFREKVCDLRPYCYQENIGESRPKKNVVSFNEGQKYTDDDYNMLHEEVVRTCLLANVRNPRIDKDTNVMIIPKSLWPGSACWDMILWGRRGAGSGERSRKCMQALTRYFSTWSASCKQGQATPKATAFFSFICDILLHSNFDPVQVLELLKSDVWMARYGLKISGNNDEENGED